jgi:hypothetical protein
MDEDIPGSRSSHHNGTAVALKAPQATFVPSFCLQSGRQLVRWSRVDSPATSPDKEERLDGHHPVQPEARKPGTSTLRHHPEPRKK